MDDDREKIRRHAQAMADAGNSAAEIEAFITEALGASGPSAPHSKFTADQLIGRADRQVANAQDEEAAAASGEDATRNKVLGTITDLSREVPGAEAAQAGIRALVRRQPYGEALKDIRGAEDTVPTPVAVAARGGGAVLSALALGKAAPGLSTTGQGMLYGALHGAAEADPESLAMRGAKTVGETALSALPGIAGNLGGRVLSKLYPSAGADASALLSAGKNALSRLRPAPAAPFALESAAETAARPALTNAAASSLPVSPKTQLAKMLQGAVDEGASDASAAADAVPPDNPDLMRRIEESLKRAKMERDNPLPRFRPTGGQSSGRSVADVLRARRP